MLNRPSFPQGGVSLELAQVMIINHMYNKRSTNLGRVTSPCVYRSNYVQVGGQTQLYLGRWMNSKDDFVINIGREPFIGLIPEVT